MNCHEMQELLESYADAELDLVRSVELEKHLAGCPNCALARKNLQVLHAALNSGPLYQKAVSPLRRSIRASLRAEHKPASGATGRSGNWLLIGLSFACGILLAALLLPATRLAGDGSIAGEVAAGHIRSLQATHLTDVASSDQHTVKPWFDGKLDFAPPVRDLGERGFPLTGGRLDYINGRAVAALVYYRQKHPINVFIWPGDKSGSDAISSVTNRGFNIVHWTQAGMTMWAASDLNQAELREFVEMLRQ